MLLFSFWASEQTFHCDMAPFFGNKAFLLMSWFSQVEGRMCAGEGAQLHLTSSQFLSVPWLDQLAECSPAPDGFPNGSMDLGGLSSLDFSSNESRRHTVVMLENYGSNMAVKAFSTRKENVLPHFWISKRSSSHKNPYHQRGSNSTT